MQMRCKCGFGLSDTLVPNDTVYHVYPDTQMVKIEESLDHTTYVKDFLFPLSEYEIWKCNRCNRIYWFRGSEKRPVRYVPEPFTPEELANKPD